MKSRLWVSSLLLFSATCFAEQNLNKIELNYQDSEARSWHRWILEEDLGKDGTLLLVIDQPVEHSLLQASVTQATVFRKLFKSKRRLSKARAYYQKVQRGLGQNQKFDPLDNTAHAPLWVATRAWTLADENDYAKWINTEITTTSYQGQGVEFDCADFSILTRWIYAHDHLLPAANTLAATNQLIGQWMGRSDWDKLATNPDWRHDERYKAALRYILDATYTHTIIQDLYPIELTPDFVTPGSIILVLYSELTGHTQVIKNIGSDEDNCGDSKCITTIWGNEPSRDIAFERVAWIMNGGSHYGGFLRWRWPVVINNKWVLQDATQMPGYSIDQYQYPSLSNSDYAAFVYNKIGLGADSFDQISVSFSLLKSMLNGRMKNVAEGFEYCGIVHCDSKGETYDAYSTPSQDAQIRNQSNQFVKLFNSLDTSDSRFASLSDQLSDSPFQLVSFSQDVDLSYRSFIFNTGGVLDRMSADPRDALPTRWGYASQNESFDVELTSWMKLWGIREDLVARAQKTCFPDSSSQSPTCNAKDEQVISLGTKMLDEALRNIQAGLVDLNAKLTDSDKAQVTNAASSEATTEQFCQNEQSAHCTANDFLFGQPNYLKNMSADPTANYETRYGY